MGQRKWPTALASKNTKKNHLLFFCKKKKTKKRNSQLRANGATKGKPYPQPPPRNCQLKFTPVSSYLDPVSLYFRSSFIKTIKIWYTSIRLKTCLVFHKVVNYIVISQLCNSYSFSSLNSWNGKIIKNFYQAFYHFCFFFGPVWSLRPSPDQPDQLGSIFDTFWVKLTRASADNNRLITKFFFV